MKTSMFGLNTPPPLFTNVPSGVPGPTRPEVAVARADEALIALVPAGLPARWAGPLARHPRGHTGGPTTPPVSIIVGTGRTADNLRENYFRVCI